MEDHTWNARILAAAGRLVLLVLLWMTSAAVLAAQPASRIAGNVEDGSRVRLAGNHHPLARTEFDAGAVDASAPMNGMVLVLRGSAQQESALARLLVEQQDPASPNYHQWLTPEQFAERFGASATDVAQVTSWLQGHGFLVEQIATSRRSITFSGTAAAVEQAFSTRMRRYRVGGELHMANESDPSIPAALAPVLSGVLALHDFRSHALHSAPRSAASGPSSAQFTFGTGHFVTPGDLALIYDVSPLYTQQVNGSGESVAVVARSNIALSDVRSFRGNFGLPAADPQVIVNGSDPGIGNQDELTEAILDVEYAAALAPQAAVKFVTSASTNTSDGSYLSAQYIVNHNVAPVMTMSFGICEASLGASGNAFFSSLWQQAASQGITVLVAAGDSGAAGCDGGGESTAVGGLGVNGLCSSPYSVCVGGTQFNDASNPSLYWAQSNSATGVSALSYIPEVVWNQSSPGLWAGGGGKSTVYSKPAWQAGPGVPADGQRDVPDLSLNASGDEGYLIVMNGNEYVVGGTSAASPTLAGIFTLVAQSSGARLGAPQAQLYAMAAAAGSAAAFHDIAGGNNSVPGAVGYNATTGYDLASGLGSVDGAALVSHWGGSTRAATPALALALAQSSLSTTASSTPSAVAVSVSASNLSSSVALSVSGLPTGVTASFSSASLSGSGSSNLQLTLGSRAAAGSYRLTVTASSGKLSAASTLALSVSAPVTPSLTLAAASNKLSVAPAASSTVLLKTAGNAGITSAVTLAATGLPSGMSAAFSPSSIAAPGTGSSTLTLAAGAGVAPGSYTVNVVAASGSLSKSVALTVNVPAFKASLSASALTLTQGAATSVTLTSTVLGGFNAAVALSVSGLPTGVTATLSNATLAAPGSGKVTLQLAATSNATTGSAPLTVTATGGGVTVTMPLALTVTPPPSFTFTASASAASLALGGKTSITFSSAALYGFSRNLTLTLSAAPKGVTTQLSATTLQPGKGGTLTITAAKTALTGSSTLTLMASGGGETVSVPVLLTVTSH